MFKNEDRKMIYKNPVYYRVSQYKDITIRITALS